MSSAGTVRKLKHAGRDAQPKERFGWAPGSRMKANAEDAADVIKTIHKRGPLTPKAIVEAAVPPQSPLHKDFTWDDCAAATKYREEEGRRILRSLVVCYLREDDTYSAPIRYTVKVSRESDEKGDVYEAVSLKPHVYIPLREAMADPDNRHRVLMQALGALFTLRKKYADYEELARVFEEIDRVREEHDLSHAELAS